MLVPVTSWLFLRCPFPQCLQHQGPVTDAEGQQVELWREAEMWTHSAKKQAEVLT